MTVIQSFVHDSLYTDNTGETFFYEFITNFEMFYGLSIEVYDVPVNSIIN